MPDNILLVTLDDKTLYINIPHKDGIAAVQTTLNRNNVYTTLTQWILRSIECILTNNNFTFIDQYSIQLQDTAMGIKMAPKYANIFMRVFEKQLLTNAPLKPIAFFRFIDDIMQVWTHGIEALNKFIEAANNLYPTIKFIHCISPEKVKFLDTTAHLVDNSLEIEIYTKPIELIKIYYQALVILAISSKTSLEVWPCVLEEFVLLQYFSINTLLNLQLI